jgi:ent-kaurenoic acid hydroxylase
MKSSEKDQEKLKEDVMSGLMQMEDENGKKLSDDEVVDNIVTLIVGAYDSTSLNVTWAAYHLAKSPDVLAKLRVSNHQLYIIDLTINILINIGMQEENLAIAKDKSGDLITLDDISQMKYTAKVVEETLRMANVAAMLFRVAHRDVHYEGLLQTTSLPPKI